MLGEIWPGGRTSRKRFWIAVFVASIATLPMVAGSSAAEGLSPQQQLAFDIYKELVEIHTVTATGDTARAAEANAARVKAAGFADAAPHAFRRAPGRGNLAAGRGATGAPKPILLVAHLDVVPASREDWS